VLALRASQFWLVSLWVGLLLGGWANIRDHEWLSMGIGLTINLLLQYALIISIKKQKLKLASEKRN
jgi:hypothetical protein